MSLYLDTSLLISALTHEVDSPQVLDWLGAQTDDLHISDWVVAEFSAALSVKLRTREIDAAQRAASLASFTNLCEHNAEVLEVTREHFRLAARLASDHAAGLRAGDALHLAVCADRGITLCTLDRRLTEAGPACGVPTVTVGSLLP